MDFTNIVIPLAASIVIGALIGLEREKTKQTAHGISPIGIRTDILICLLGAISALIGKLFDPIVFIICFAAILVLIISAYIYLAINKQRIGITTEISTILVFLLGALTMINQVQIALVIAIIITLILSLRQYLHKTIEHINSHEIYDTIKFAIIAFIILPFLPNTNFDQAIFAKIFPNATIPEAFNQIQILNPYRIWFLVVLVSGISFLGYILVKTIGKNKGISITGLIGGLYSSTATSLTLARKSKQYPSIKRPFITGIVLACAISFLRTFLEIRILNEELFYRILIPIALMGGYLSIVGIYLFLSNKDKKIDKHLEFKTPFELKEAIKLGGFIVLALLMAKILLSYAGVNYYYLVSAFMALFAIDDPIVISTSVSAGKIIDFDQAKNVIILVTYLNMAQKVGLIYLVGNRKLFKEIAIIFAGLLLVTLVGLIYF